MIELIIPTLQLEIELKLPVRSQSSEVTVVTDQYTPYVDHKFPVLRNCDHGKQGLMFIHAADGGTYPAKAVGVYIAVCVIL
jgi:hypothetical protein